MIHLVDKYLDGFIKQHEMAAIKSQASLAYESVISKSGAGSDYLGWVTLPSDYDKDEFERIKLAAERIKKSSNVLLVIGIGGSYLGARAAIEFCKSAMYNNLKKDTPEIYFLGNNISANHIKTILELCEGKDYSVNVVSKSGTTTEPALAFRIVLDEMKKKYSEEEMKSRIFVTTDKEKGTLLSFARQKGYETFVVPDDVGGRYSVLTAVGLLPIAAAGIDIDSMMNGARDSVKGCIEDACKYASVRNVLYRKGYTVEFFIGYEPNLTMTAEWWKQLYGESEGKDHKGIFPASAIFSTDLHSLGQYIQDGLRNIFETVLFIKNPGIDIPIGSVEDNIDGLNFLDGKTVKYVNTRAFEATVLAHSDGGVPNIILELDGMTPYDFGAMAYFYEMACGVSGYMMGINPFDQPGVEAYKKNMFALLGKPGYEDLKKKLENRI